MAKRAILIAGPTASGKSALAIKLACQTNGVIVNADSMQVYSVLNVLSARPREDDLASAEHHLYGYVSPVIQHSTGAWFRDVDGLMAKLRDDGRLLIFVGGTGLYFQALTDGFTLAPSVPSEIVGRIESEVAPLNKQQRLDLLQKKDPLMAERLLEPDSQRVIRALSVLAATGRSLAVWQDEPRHGLLEEFELEKIVISPQRDVLRDRIRRRFAAMVEDGGVEEVTRLRELNLNVGLPAMKAIGVREIGDWLGGAITKEEAIERAVIASHQYAKRQRTWFRKQMKAWDWRE